METPRHGIALNLWLSISSRKCSAVPFSLSFLPSEISRFVHFIVVVLGMPSAVWGAWGQTQDLTCKAPALPPTSIHSLKYSFISRGCFWTVASIYPRTAGLSCIFSGCQDSFWCFQGGAGTRTTHIILSSWSQCWETCFLRFIHHTKEPGPT